jgi:glyoxylase-like metal-dependent hydrolase (beta-lactamase superfamily II)
MKLISLTTGSLAVNTYFVPLVAPTQGPTPVIVVDPGDDGSNIVAALKANAMQVVAIALTHHHFDHVLGLKDVLEHFPGIHVGGHTPQLVQNQPTPDTVFLEGTLLDCLVPEQPANVRHAAAAWSVLHTPGHTTDSVCLYNEAEKQLISGDTLFWGTYGRTDLPGGNEEQMVHSLDRLFRLPPDTLIYPGHDRYGFVLAANRFYY